MKFPYFIAAIDQQLKTNFQIRFNSGQFDRSIKEGVWRRHQEESNAANSGWKTNNDQRRRIFHYRDKYNSIDDQFILESTYQYLSVKAPKNEIDAYVFRISESLKKWERKKCEFEYGDLRLIFWVCDNNEKDPYPFPNSYQELNIQIRSDNFLPNTDLIDRPWNIFKKGIRKSIKQGVPTYNVTSIKDFLPAHVELGCGPSIEAGIPPLNFLHKIYSTSNPDGSFMLTAENDNYLDIIADPIKKIGDMTYIHKCCLQATPTPFYSCLKALQDNGNIIGPIFTNNFDGLCLSVGLEEYCLRQHDKDGEYPEMSFNPHAKSLLVIGSHADRRMVQHHARKNGLKIIFIDPQGYENGTSYPLESPQDNDIVIKMSAQEFSSNVISLCN